MNHATNLSNQELISEALKNNEGVLAANGALSTITGLRTGRSPNDRFIVKENSTEEQIDWGDINKPFEEDKFHALWNKVSDYLSNKKTYTTNVHVGSNDDHYLPVKVTTETAWHSLFSKLIFVVPQIYNHTRCGVSRADRARTRRCASSTAATTRYSRTCCADASSARRSKTCASSLPVSASSRSRACA